MSQVDLPSSIGYALKQVTVALRAAMEVELRGSELGVSQYAVLELLAQRPGLSNTELARSVFVTRQATHQLLAGLRQAGLVEVEGTTRKQQVVISELGSRRLAHVSHRIALVEQRMLAGLSVDQQTALHRGLLSCVEALAADQTDIDPAGIASNVIDPADPNQTPDPTA